MTEESSRMRAISGSGPAHCVVEPFIRFGPDLVNVGSATLRQFRVVFGLP